MLTKKSSRKMHTNLNKYQIPRGKPSHLTGTKFNVPMKSFTAGQVEISSRQTGTKNLVLLKKQLFYLFTNSRIILLKAKVHET